ncbi:NAD-dependent epimerase/dehydratase family protein [Kocuria rhizophila]|uniref:NAD-dependent epimerase/dehydratase family protein n=1 Tax=Kocuria rhizophila TaxID=72000 RepID=UPI0021A855DC|nr:NAD-dependent epimerase/dehydratase family protein [Kocuria rhizophila]MCT2249477.1 NAD-dependent epimerase/dehydratase family protein [Kocuria rhizophila]
MTVHSWRVLGATGFIGSAITTALQARSIPVTPVASPRLASPATTVHHLVEHAQRLESVIDYLADSFAGADTVVNAAGLAAPDQTHQQSLTGANALLPVLVALAAHRTGVRRVIHMSSASVQADTPVLDESIRTAPFSPYSFSKALGESALYRLHSEWRSEKGAPQLTVIRATSVMGSERRTTRRLARFASSPLSSVAGDGSAPTPVTSVTALAQFTVSVGEFPRALPPVILQPWEGATTGSVLRDAGRREPLSIPPWLCRAAIASARFLSQASGHRYAGAIRRLEVTWFGQQQVPGWAHENGVLPEPHVQEVLRQAHLALGR